LKETKRIITLDRYEHGILVNALNNMRNNLIQMEQPTDAVDDLLLKTIDAPNKNTKN